jgi:hypothetical protein
MPSRLKTSIRKCKACRGVEWHSITFSTPEGAFGGHLEPGCIAYVLCEVFFAEVEGVSMTRQRVPVSVEGMGEGNILRLMFGDR